MIGSVLQTQKIILDWLHVSPVRGHSGIRATEKQIKVMFYWKHMLKDIKVYLLHCEPCLRCKNETVPSLGLLQPLPIPPRVWFSIAMDFIEGLPKSGGKEIIWIVVDKLSKYTHFIALAQPLTSVTLA